MKQDLKKYACLVLITGLLLVFIVPVQAASPSDYKGNWAENQIGGWFDKGLAVGYNDGTFRPDRAISRAEFVALINRAFNFTKKTDTNFSDVPAGAWFKEEVAKAAAAEYVSDDTTGKFRPYDPVSRMEAAKILTVLLKWNTNRNTDTLQSFKDADNVPDWGKPYLIAAIDEKYMQVSSDGWILPYKSVSRAEAVALLDKAKGGSQVSPSIPEFKAEQEFKGILYAACCKAEPPENETKLILQKTEEGGYGVNVKQDDGTYKFYKFDENGQELAKDIIEYSTSTSYIRLTVKGIDGALPDGELKILDIDEDT